MKNVLSIAGSDCSGGAGIQADLKTMCALGVYGMTVITAITAQNTKGVFRVTEAGADIVEAQINAVFSDIRVDAVKVGMVSKTEIIHTIKNCLKKYNSIPVVVDPVMVSKSGFSLLRDDAISAVKELVSIANVITPNVPEAEILSGVSIKTENDIREAAYKIAALGASNVLIKGGHLEEEQCADLLLTPKGFLRLTSERINTKHTHGTGCTLSSAIACRLAAGDDLETAVRAAKAYITQAITDCYAVGKGAGPVGHLNALYRRAGMEF